MKVVIIDKHVLFREGLTSLLSGQPDFEIVGSAGTAEIGIEIVMDLQPDLVLLDVDLPDTNGLNVLRIIYVSCPGTKTVILTANDSKELLFESIQAGAYGFIPKDTPISNLMSSLRAIDRGELALTRAMTTRVVEEFRRLNNQPAQRLDGIEHLTGRELDILIMLGQHASNRQIGQSLFIAENTVKVHVHNILDKLQVSNRREAGSLARYLGLTKPAQPLDQEPGNGNGRAPGAGK
ncbi:MAG: two component transcriptional regulator, LuxR family [Chloroflexi bacterium]|jgi:DNA-binding NarL/FixJ family response regulator|nr:two component transcriptional regulator, LuxR family [Chloroflexota bacterium]